MQIDLIHVAKEYTKLGSGQRTALDGITCTLHTGEILGIVGAAGAGKSTLLAILAGRATPSHGQVRIDGRAVDVGELARISRLHANSATLDAANDIANDATLILLDEPVPAPTRAALQRLTQTQRAVVVATRSIPLAIAVCDRVALLCAGRLGACLSTAELAQLARSTVAEIRVHGHVDGDWADWFGGLVMSYPHPEETLMRGTVRDQTELYGILARMRDMSIPLLAVNITERNLDALVADLCADHRAGATGRMPIDSRHEEG